MIWVSFEGERVDPRLILEAGGIRSKEYEEIIYDRLLSIVSDLLQLPEDHKTIIIVNSNSFLFMHNNVSYYKTENISQLLGENSTLIMNS